MVNRRRDAAPNSHIRKIKFDSLTAGQKFWRSVDSRVIFYLSFMIFTPVGERLLAPLHAWRRGSA
jgi:hypothetical protein